MEFNFEQIYNFLFQSFAGVGILILAFVVVSIIAAFALEQRTQKILNKKIFQTAKKYQNSLNTTEPETKKFKAESSIEKIDKENL